MFSKFFNCWVLKLKHKALNHDRKFGGVGIAFFVNKQIVFAAYQPHLLARLVPSTKKKMKNRRQALVFSILSRAILSSPRTVLWTCGISSLSYVALLQFCALIKDSSVNK
jgi:hypothetical protein